MSFDREDYEHTAKLLRSGNQKVVDAALSNNFNIILAALDAAAKLQPSRVVATKESEGFVVPALDFDDFWAAYPKRDGSNPKKPALQKFKILITKHKVKPETLVAGARELAAQHRGK